MAARSQPPKKRKRAGRETFSKERRRFLKTASITVLVTASYSLVSLSHFSCSSGTGPSGPKGGYGGY